MTQLRRWLSPLLALTLVTALAPSTAWAAGSEPSKDKAKTTNILQSAITRAAANATATPSLQLHRMPASGSSQTRKQVSGGGGGGHTGMIIGLVTAVVGIGATVYMVKEMEKTTKNLPTPY